MRSLIERLRDEGESFDHRGAGGLILEAAAALESAESKLHHEVEVSKALARSLEQAECRLHSILEVVHGAESDPDGALDRILAICEGAVETRPPKYCKACGAAPGEECNTASTLERPSDCINAVETPGYKEYPREPYVRTLTPEQETEGMKQVLDRINPKSE